MDIMVNSCLGVINERRLAVIEELQLDVINDSTGLQVEDTVLYINQKYELC